MIETENLSKRYDGKEVLNDITFEVDPGEFFGLIGPSGSGKSTLLRILDLIEQPTAGSLRLFGEDPYSSGHISECRRRMAMLFQRPIVFNANVHENIAIGMKYRKKSRQEIRERVKGALDAIGLEGYGNRPARTLSGGEAQRVALARAMVLDPEILFLDEPTANLDPISVDKIEEIVHTVNRESGTTVIISTHDMLQGQRLARRIGVVMEGRLPQIGTTMEIFHKPVTKDIAHFVGMENILSGKIAHTHHGEVDIEVADKNLCAVSPLPQGQSVSVLFRAEDVTLNVSDLGKTSARNVFHGTISRIIPSGPFVHVVIDCGIPLTSLVTIRSVEDLGLKPGTEVWASFKATSIHVIPDR